MGKGSDLAPVWKKAAVVSVGGGPSVVSEIDVAAEPFVAIPFAIDGTEEKQLGETAPDRLRGALEPITVAKISGSDRLAAHELKSLVKNGGHG